MAEIIRTYGTAVVKWIGARLLGTVGTHKHRHGGK
jgi:hypothetical protein